MKRAALCVLVACTPFKQEVSHASVGASVDGDGLRGAEISGTHAINGIGVSLDVAGQSLERDEPLLALHRRDVGVGIDLGMRVSALGLFAPDDHVTRWFDVGVAGAAGGGLVYAGRMMTYGQLWGGGFVEIGLSPHHIHPALVLEVRRESISDWDDRTVFLVGVTLARRYDTAMLGMR